MSQEILTIKAARYRAIVFDMDGVITRTAAVHAHAWKQMFDDLLRRQEERTGRPQPPFDIVDDYRAYVDGKPRLDGLKSFLDSRNIDLPWGDPADPVGADTVQGLGKLKNQIFQELLGKMGVETFPGSVLLAGRAKITGLRTAIVTSSKNGPLIMERSGLLALFDSLVDGNVSAELSLRGKPDPDIMIEAVHRLGVAPSETVLFEDAVSGVQAGRAAAMGLVVGVARAENHTQLKEGGADTVVDDLSMVRLLATRPRSTANVPSAAATDVLKTLGAMTLHVPRTAIFLDYDGTLTPIVERPELAQIDEMTRETIARLAEHCLVAVISGRSLEDVRSLVGLENLYYAGSHGFEISGPKGMVSLLQQGEECLPVIDRVEEDLRDRLGQIEGVLFERKPFSLAIHFRLAAPDAELRVSGAVDEVMSRYQGLRRSGGKKVIEVQPGIDWDKGKAVEWLMERLGLDPGVSLIIYLGDDLTDENAFRTLQGRGVGIVVRDLAPRPTYADLALDDTEAVRVLLEEIMLTGNGRETGGR
jgi:trehalose 6-phosphate phosphatase